jgi:hypothetical protein
MRKQEGYDDTVQRTAAKVTIEDSWTYIDVLTQGQTQTTDNKQIFQLFPVLDPAVATEIAMQLELFHRGGGIFQCMLSPLPYERGTNILSHLGRQNFIQNTTVINIALYQ